MLCNQQVSNPDDHGRRRLSSINQADQLTELMKSKDLTILGKLNGVKGLTESLGTSLENGRDTFDIERRKISFGSNNICKKSPTKVFFGFVLKAFKDANILIQLVYATLSLGLGIKENGAKDGWYEGGSTFMAVFLVVVISSICNFRQQQHIDRFSKRSYDNMKIHVLRDGRQENIFTRNLVVGDIIFLKTGTQIPADGLFIDGDSLKVDESNMTGESDHKEIDAQRNPFLFAGSKVAHGHARMLAISVGMNTTWGKIMSDIDDHFYQHKPTKTCLDTLISLVATVGLALTLLDLVITSILYATGNTKDTNGNWDYNGQCTDSNEILNSFTRAVTAVAEGLQLALTLSHSFSINRMINVDHVMVRELSACDRLGSTTVICSDKTGTLTENKMTVTNLFIGFDRVKHVSPSLINPKVLELIHQGAHLYTTGGSGYSSTEIAILSWDVTNLGMDKEKLKRDFTVLHVEPFNSEKRRSGVSIKKNEDDSVHVHWKGDAEVILAMCSGYYKRNGSKKPMSRKAKAQFKKIIQEMAKSGLNCIAFAHKKNGSIYKQMNENHLTLLGIVGMKNPCRTHVEKAIKACRFDGVEIKMITGDDILIAKAIAIECGILEASAQEISKEVVIEGEEFRKYTDDERMEKVDSIRVMARSSPSDKLLMVECLKKKGHVVAVISHDTNDAPALKEAHIGISIGTDDMANESSDIVILNKGFESVVNALLWGRCVQNNIQIFFQFQLTANVVALVINFVSSASVGGAPFLPVQQLCVNLIVNVLGSLALATQRPTEELMHKPPVDRDAPLVTKLMWKNLLAQSLYQITILLIFEFRGESIFEVNESVKNSIIFNTFVLSQVFNLLNARKLEKKNIFEGLHRKWLFIGILGLAIVTQVVLMEFLNDFAGTQKLNGEQWGICIGVAALTLPIGWFVKLTLPIGRFVKLYQFQKYLDIVYMQGRI